jgi:UDPglucose 6-dehydrogenase
MKVTIFGTGYVGLVQGAVLADAGHTVMCVDADETKLARLRADALAIVAERSFTNYSIGRN